MLGHGRDLPSVTAALLHGDIDAGFGRVHPPLHTGLAHRLVRLEPVDAVLGADHPLAAEPDLRPDQLRDAVLWAPGPLDRLDFLHQFADRFAIRNRATSVNLGLAPFLAEVAAGPRRFSLLPADVPLPDVPGPRSVRSSTPRRCTPGHWCGAPAPATRGCTTSSPPAPRGRGAAGGWSTTRPATGCRNRRRPVMPCDPGPGRAWRCPAG
ncbi:hypothetical protein GCM10010345_73490 [Streptomyces canarius]|uniref:LysR substrate-binding domain-containing protein n=1 Tax=Streptomyces canarius TaxID=285453 RepID=A0ABQ3D4L1_9ACTN|nr:hypothetical protein GCM10010345_73490 [Streptomyces canarius]